MSCEKYCILTQVFFHVFRVRVFLILAFESKNFRIRTSHASKIFEIQTTCHFEHVLKPRIPEIVREWKGDSLEDFKLKKNYGIQKTVHAGYAKVSN